MGSYRYEEYHIHPNKTSKPLKKTEMILMLYILFNKQFFSHVGLLTFLPLVEPVPSSSVEAHIIVKRYWQPDLVLGRGPTQSMMILLKGSSKAGMGCKQAFVMV